jgi:hypothetical protein
MISWKMPRDKLRLLTSDYLVAPNESEKIASLFSMRNKGPTPLSRFNFNIKKYPSIWLKGGREYRFSKNRFRFITNSITNFFENANCGGLLTCCDINFWWVETYSDKVSSVYENTIHWRTKHTSSNSETMTIYWSR